MYRNKSKPVVNDKKGLDDCEIKQYNCNGCSHRFLDDISSIIHPKTNISDEVLDLVRKYY